MITTTAIIPPVIIISIISHDFCFKIGYDIANLILSHFYYAFIGFSTIASRIVALSYDTPHFSIYLFLKKTLYAVHLSFRYEEKRKRKGKKNYTRKGKKRKVRIYRERKGRN